MALVQPPIFLDIPAYAASEADMDAFAAGAIDTFLEKNWSVGDLKPVVHYDPRTVAPASRASLHAKCIVVDGRRRSAAGRSCRRCRPPRRGRRG